MGKGGKGYSTAPRNSGVKRKQKDGSDESSSTEKRQVRILLFARLVKILILTFASIFLVPLSIGKGQLGDLWETCLVVQRTKQGCQDRLSYNIILLISLFDTILLSKLKFKKCDGSPLLSGGVPQLQCD